MGPRGPPGGSLGPQRPVNRGSKGEKWPILVTVSVSRGAAQGAIVPRRPRNLRNPISVLPKFVDRYIGFRRGSPPRPPPYIYIYI